MLYCKKTDLLEIFEWAWWQFEIFSLYMVQVILFLSLPRITAYCHDLNTLLFHMPRQEVNDAVPVFDVTVPDIVE